ncbi:MAG TPA: zeta toxin family protein [Acidimicrobiales bacterium]|nr:zeta toxin family protein [Acidimicrobiales bacterium]
METDAIPVLVLVGGPGGAGKTTLARSLGDRMGLVHLCRDSVKAAIATTNAVTGSGVAEFDDAKAGMGGEYGQRAFAATYAAAGALLDGGASVVVDQAWRAGLSEGELQPLLASSRSVLLIATATHDIEVSRARQRGDRTGLAPLVQALSDAANDRHAFLEFDVGIPRLAVDSTDGYDPSLSDIEAWIWQHVF